MDAIQKIPLREYYRKIDKLIVDQQFDSAISYAEYLLEKYPKNISVYKLLGKAFLGKHEFDYANTIFEKILEVEPDDFVSHIGISIIAESFGNLEKSLNSMRRAYELDPSNESLQAEIKRILKRKDGVAPDKVQLTRGALIKMYSRSKLPEQTIAEARLGIQENPNRIDYKIYLSNMLFFSGNKIKAIETCIGIISMLPYCKPALIILYKSLASLHKTSDSTVYKLRLTEIDPYYSFIKPDTNSVNDIPDIAIMVEERKKPISPIDNINYFINEAWKKTAQYESLPSTKDNNEDWSTIIKDAVSNNRIGAPISDTSFEEVVSPNIGDDNIPRTRQQNTPPISTKKDKFRKKLSALQENAHDEKIIPEWVFEDILSNNTNKNNNDLSEESKFSERSLNDGLEKRVEPADSFIKISHPNGKANDEPSVNLSMNSSDLDQVASTNNHLNSELTNENTLVVSTPLDDTQKLNILPEDLNELTKKAFNSIDVGNIKFALQCLNKAINNTSKLDGIASQLEDVCLQYPAEVDLWLILAEVYQKLGQNEKSLEILEKAQNNITF